MDLPEVVLAVDPAWLGHRAAGAGSARLTPAMRLCTPYCRGRTNSSGVSREPAWLAAQGARFPNPGLGSLATVPAEQADQGPPAPARRRPVHRRRRLSRRGLPVHHQGAGSHQGRGGQSGARGGPIRPASLRRPPALGQDQTGAQAAPVGGALHASTSRRGLPESPGG